MAKCIISKPTIRKMGEDEEKIYCGMISLTKIHIVDRNVGLNTPLNIFWCTYFFFDHTPDKNSDIFTLRSTINTSIRSLLITDGPEYTDYEFKAQKRIAKTVKKTLLKHVPILNDILEKKRAVDKENIKKDFNAWLEIGRRSILEEKEEELKKMEIEAMNQIHLTREKVVSELKGKMEEEIKMVNETKKEYLKSVYEFQLKYLLKDNEQKYVERMNLYSAIWNKILRRLIQRAKRKISELNCSANQFINSAAVQAIVEKENYENSSMIDKFHDLVENAVRELKSKVLTEELHIQQERRRGNKIKNVVKGWNSLLEHVIMLFDKVVVFGFRGKPGECNYFLDRGIMEKINKISQEADEIRSADSKSADKVQEIEISEEQSTVLSCDTSVSSIDMTVDPPDKDLIIELNLFQLKKLIEEVTCQVLVKPLQIAQFMRDKSVELKPFSAHSDQESSYILNRLADAYTILEKMLFKSKGMTLAPKAKEVVPYTIETDPEFKERIDYLIKCYKVNPDYMRALTNV